MADPTAAVLAALGEGRGRRQQAMAVACEAGASLQDTIRILRAAHLAGTVGRMEAEGRESWWRWPPKVDGPIIRSDEGLFPA